MGRSPAIPARGAVIAALAVVGALVACGGDARDDHGRSKTFSEADRTRAQAFLDNVKPPSGFSRTTKNCLSGAATRCFTSTRIVRPFTPSSLMTTIRKFGLKPDPSQLDCQHLRI